MQMEKRQQAWVSHSGLKARVMMMPSGGFTRSENLWSNLKDLGQQKPWAETLGENATEEPIRISSGIRQRA